MAEIKLKEGSLVTPINDGASLADGVRAAGDYDNSANLDMWCHAYLTVQWDTTPPTAGDIVAELYLLPGDGETSQVFPEGGDAGLGSDKTPQKMFLVGVFETVDPSVSADEVIAIPNIRLSFEGNRFVLLNTSGQTMDSTWQLDIKTYKMQSA